MKNTVLLIALAGLTTAGTAQEFSLSFGEITGDVSTGSMLSVDVFGDASIGTHMLGGGFAVSAFTNNFEVLDMTWAPAPWSAFNTDGGHAGSGNYDSVIFGQLNGGTGIPPFDQPSLGSELGSLIGSFQIEVGQLGSFWSLQLQLVEHEPFPFTLEVLDYPDGGTYQNELGNITLGSARVDFIPAPSSLALLGLGGLAASRRRR